MKRELKDPNFLADARWYVAGYRACMLAHGIKGQPPDEREIEEKLKESYKELKHELTKGEQLS